jgi:hemolysin III
MVHAERHHREELANALTHGAGAIASLAGGAVLITLTAVYGSTRELVSVSVYSATLLLLYVASTLYHAIRHDLAKARLKVFDHCAIFLLIAGTYTPFTLVSLRGGWGWSLFGVVWGLAVAGVVFKLFLTGRFKGLSTLIYVAMGWIAIVAIGPLVSALPVVALVWLLIGGVAYTAGTCFYHRPSVPYAHAIWHGFVLAGSVCHFVAVALVVLGST